jgi:hypothetical protein
MDVPAGMERCMPFPAKTGLRGNRVSKRKPAHPFPDTLVSNPKDAWGDQPADVAVAKPAAEQ